MIGLCCDSGAQLPPETVARWNIEVVPLTVTVDGIDHLEGVDLDADGFWSFFADGRTPDVSTASPSPGRFVEAYQRLVAAGATEIVSVHTGSEISATFDAARLAARQIDVPVELVDTGAASFMVGCAALAAAEHLEAGWSAARAAERARHVAAACGNVFVVGALDLPRSGGRLAEGVGPGTGGAVTVLRLADGKMTGVGEAGDVDEAAEKMAAEILGAGERLRVGIAVADPSSVVIAARLRRHLEDAPAELDLLEYRVGPSVGAHTGPGTAGAVYHPLAAASRRA